MPHGTIIQGRTLGSDGPPTFETCEPPPPKARAKPFPIVPKFQQAFEDYQEEHIGGRYRLTRAKFFDPQNPRCPPPLSIQWRPFYSTWTVCCATARTGRGRQLWLCSKRWGSTWMRRTSSPSQAQVRERDRIGFAGSNRNHTATSASRFDLLLATSRTDGVPTPVS